MGLILKYPLTDVVTHIDVHQDARIISWAMQADRPHVWIDTTPEGHGPRRIMRVRVFMTGESFPSNHYVLKGTIFDNPRGLVYHIAEQIKDDPEVLPE